MDLEMQELLIHRPFSRFGDITCEVRVPESYGGKMENQQINLRRGHEKLEAQRQRC